MLLNEFFGKAINPTKELEKDRDSKEIGDDLFWYIVDHDRLHKDYFHPIAKKMMHAHKKNKLSKDEMEEEFMPMVKKGCMEYYHHKKMDGKPEKIFNKELCKDMCEKLFNHYKEDVVKGHYKLGQ